MGLPSACVDRARIVRKLPSGPRIEGRSQFVTVTEQWFRCRLFLTSTTDVPDPQASHWLSQSAPQLLCVSRDIDGNPLVLRSDLHIDVNSVELGRAIWRMAGEAEPLRKKRRLIGYLALLSRVVEREFEDIFNEDVPDASVLGPPPVV